MPRNKQTDELATTLTTLTLFHEAVRHADHKARTVVAIQTMLMATVSAQFVFLLAPGTMLVVAQLALLAVLVPGYVHSSCHLLRALLPRMARTSARNPFAFPSVAATTDIPELPVSEQRAHAHEVSRVLARLAMVKHWHIRRALYGTGALFVSTVGSLGLVALS